jgi:hypothetical protein
VDLRGGLDPPLGAYAVQIIDDRALQPGSGTYGLNVLAFAASPPLPLAAAKASASRRIHVHTIQAHSSRWDTMRAFGGVRTCSNCSDKDLQVCARCHKGRVLLCGAPEEGLEAAR